ncbi:MAG TPA: FkbM family methyltransferase [Longimicrobiales bacterium]|nr:FkbM family methyltransferase [Longimicrobiales bacterium]
MTHFGSDLVRLPITRGVLRGRWWLPASRGKILRILGGTYEPEQTRAFQKLLQPGDTVLDVGAHVGYYTLLASVLVGDKGRVFSFEPDPRNARFLRRHVHMNARQNVRVEEAAVSDARGSARFERGTGSGTGHLAGSGGFEVRTLRLDDFCADRGIAPAAVKIDVEGAEAAVLAGARETILNARPVVFLSTHGADVHAACLARLAEAAYDVAPIVGRDVETSSELLCTPR